jgi:hypothetical protein
MRRMPLFGFMIAAALLVAGGTPVSAQQPMATQVYGGSGGNAFADLDPPDASRIIEVRIRSGEMVDSVQMVYGLIDGRNVVGPLHGGSGGGLNSFRLDADEYIIGLSGRYGRNLDSLRIITNKRTSQTYGGRGGTNDLRIDVPSGYLVIGFAGRSGVYMDAIGLTYAPIYYTSARHAVVTSTTGLTTSVGLAPTQVGLTPIQIAQTNIAGGNGGSEFSDRDIPAGARIAEVRIWSGDGIDSLQLVYLLSDGRLQQGVRHGGSSGNAFVIRLDSDEYITGISGRAGVRVDSMRIVTNKRTSLTFGGRGGDGDFRIDLPRGGQAVGFAGRAGSMIDAIGLTYISSTSSRRSPGTR